MPFELPESAGAGETTLEQTADLNAFLREVEMKAYRIAVINVRDRDEALDIVQDAMLRLATRYAGRPSDEWRPLFYRILTNRVRDWHRRRAVSGRILSFFGGQDGELPDPIVAARGPSDREPHEEAAAEDTMRALEQALAALPERQRQAFMLRNFEDLDVAQTAVAMGCSDGSVKTHYSRAVRRLRELLGELES